MARADALIAKGDDDSLRYACLELRMAIEHLFYDLIPSHADEVPTDIIRRWQPARVIEALTDCDPHIQSGGRVEICDNRGTPISVFETKGVTKHLIKAHWHKLGSFLHAAMPGAQSQELGKLGPFLHETLAALREYKDERALTNLGSFLVFECTCGRRIKRNSEALKVKPRIICPDVDCGQIWESAADDYKRVRVARTWYKCGKCGEENEIEERERADGKVLTCENCGVVYDVRRELVLALRKS